VNGYVEDEHGHERDNRGRPERRKSSEHDGGRGEDRKQHVPRALLDSSIESEPPDIVPVWILQACERHLRTFPHARIHGHAVNKCLERLEMSAEGGCSETVIESVLAECALRAIDSGKDVLEVEISPCPLIKGSTAEGRHSTDMRSGHGVHATGAFDRHPPRGTKSSESSAAATRDRCGC